MEKMTLGRALRFQKRVKEKIHTLEQDIQNANSMIEGSEREIEIFAALEDRKKLVKQLMLLKIETQKASRPILSKILELGEFKAEIAFLNRIDTTHGKVKDGYSEMTTEFHAILRKKDKNQRISDLKDQIDAFQTSIDTFNAGTDIEIPSLNEIE